MSRACAAGSTPIDFAYAVHTDVGDHTVGAKVNGRIVPLHTSCSSGDIVEIITTQARAAVRHATGWAVVITPRATQKIRQHFRREQREDSEHSGRDLLQEMLRREGLPAQKILSVQGLSQIVKELGYQKADDLYVALGSGRIPVRAGSQQGHAAQPAPEGGGARGRDAAHRGPTRAPRRAPPRASSASPSRA